MRMLNVDDVKNLLKVSKPKPACLLTYDKF